MRKKMKIENLIKRYEKIEHYVSPAGLVIGFFWHVLYLKRIDLLYDNLLIVFYLCLTAMAIVYLNAYQIGRLRGRFFEIISIIVPFFLQFSIGGLFSSFLIFYGESGSISVSWPFLAVLVLLLVGNEFFRSRYQIFIIQICSFFLVVFLYLVFALPILLDKIGDTIFLLSGGASVVIIILFVSFLRLVARQTVKKSEKWLIGGVAAIFITLNILYFTNIIPPIPLSLKEGTIAHSVKRVTAGWVVKIEPKPWFLFWRDYNPVIHWQSGQRVYTFTAVFAPTKIKTEIYHVWSFYDSNLKEWVEKSKINYEIVGGRDGGYRGYSYKQSLAPGKWRVDIVNSQGQVLGRLPFKIVQADTPPELKEIIY